MSRPQIELDEAGFAIVPKEIRCYEGWKHNACDAVLPDSSYETMTRLGWGWVQRPDAHRPDGNGPYYACPDHKEP